MPRSLFSGTPTIIAPQVQRNPLADALLAQGLQNRPIRTHTEGLGKLAQALSGAYMQALTRNKMQERQTGASDTLAQAMMAMQGKPAETVNYGDGTTVNFGPQPGGLKMALPILAENPDTAPIGLQLQMQDIQAKRKLAQTLAGEDRRFERQKELAEFKSDLDADKPDRTLVEIYDPNSPTGTRLVPRDQAANQPGKPGSGLKIESDGKGGFVVTQGRGAASGGTGLQKTTLNKIEEAQFKAVENLDRLNAISKSFKPEFLTFGAGWEALSSNIKEKAGFKLDQGEKKFVQDFTAFRRASLSNLNRTLKEMSGAAINEQEAKRLNAELPNAGTGVFDGDGPTEFKTKLDESTRNMKRAIIRYNYAKRLGQDPLKTGIELADVDALVERRGQEIEAELKAQNPQADPSVIQLQVRDMLAREFGLQ